jgi:hypothetical protein
MEIYTQATVGTKGRRSTLIFAVTGSLGHWVIGSLGHWSVMGYVVVHREDVVQVVLVREDVDHPGKDLRKKLAAFGLAGFGGANGAEHAEFWVMAEMDAFTCATTALAFSSSPGCLGRSGVMYM